MRSSLSVEAMSQSLYDVMVMSVSFAAIVPRIADSPQYCLYYSCESAGGLVQRFSRSLNMSLTLDINTSNLIIYLYCLVNVFTIKQLLEPR